MASNRVKKIRNVLAILVALVVLAGAMWKLDGRYAKADDVQAAQEQIVDQINDLHVETIEDRISRIRNQLWQIEDKYGADPNGMPELSRDRHRRLTCEIKDQEEKLDRIYDGN